MVSNGSDENGRGYLYKAILSLSNEQEVADFLDDLCTVPEIKSMSQRLQVAKMLYTSHVYTDIVEETGASTATISRVNRTLNDGHDNAVSGRGYRLVLTRLGEKAGAPEGRGRGR